MSAEQPASLDDVIFGAGATPGASPAPEATAAAAPQTTAAPNSTTEASPQPADRTYTEAEVAGLFARYALSQVRQPEQAPQAPSTAPTASQPVASQPAQRRLRLALPQVRFGKKQAPPNPIETTVMGPNGSMRTFRGTPKEVAAAIKALEAKRPKKLRKTKAFAGYVLAATVVLGACNKVDEYVQGSDKTPFFDVTCLNPMDGCNPFWGVAADMHSVFGAKRPRNGAKH